MQTSLSPSFQRKLQYTLAGKLTGYTLNTTVAHNCHSKANHSRKSKPLNGTSKANSLTAKANQHSTAPHHTTPHHTAQHSTAQHSTTHHITSHHITALHSTAQHSTNIAQQSTAQHSKAQHHTTPH